MHQLFFYYFNNFFTHSAACAVNDYIHNTKHRRRDEQS